MLVNMKQVLSIADAGGYAVGSFNVYSYETIRGVLESARKNQIPAILAFGERYLENMDFETAAAMVKSESKDMDIPFALHLDHCTSLENVYRAIKAGFTSVMYDGSALSYSDNVANTAKAVEVAHACGVSVEAELGSLASGEHSHEGSTADEEIYTSPDQAEDFVRRTGVDALAVSIGTVHGLYKGEPNIRVDILRSIKKQVTVPLVLHGGSGTPENVLRECIRHGIRKINVNTEISVFTVEHIKELLKETTPHLSVLSLQQINAIKQVVEKYMLMFR
ncbi:class II fructose-bisphosphate aldolase [Paenibacillus sp. BR2-3]|uniref:class II fructose-bisphosphate aldolase n=1 Tax=Paenibacillus sp. BR2-3 TaxID=3048494 RepID=UPI003977D604